MDNESNYSDNTHIQEKINIRYEYSYEADTRLTPNVYHPQLVAGAAVATPTSLLAQLTIRLQPAAPATHLLCL